MNRRTGSSWWMVPALALLLATGYLFLAEWTDFGYLLQPLALAGAVAIAVIGLDLLFGLGRQLNLGHAFFFGVSAYVSGVLAGSDHGWPPLLALVTAVAFVTLLAYPIGKVLLRLEGFYFAAATLGLAVIGHDLLHQTRSITGGADGLSIPVFEVWGYRFDTPLRILLLTWVPALVIIVLGRHLARSRRGLVTRSLGEDEALTAAQGVDVAAAKVQLFLLSACFAGLGGALYGFASGYVFPGTAGLTTSLEMVVVVVLGGAGTIIGPTFATVFVRLLPAAVESLESRLDLVYGTVLIVLLLILPLRLPPLRSRKEEAQVAEPTPEPSPPLVEEMSQ